MRAIEKLFDTSHLRNYAENVLRLNVKVREKQVRDTAILKVTIFTPWGVKLNGKETDVMNFEISGKLEGNNKLVIHYLVLWASTALARLAPQIEKGEITYFPETVGAL